MKEGKKKSETFDVLLKAMKTEPEKISIPLGDGFSLVAEKSFDPDYKEIFVYIRDDKDGLVHQDLVVIGEEYKYGDEGIVPVHGQYSVKVYTDEYSEDWQAEHKISLYKEEENV